MPERYTENLSGKKVMATRVSGNMSLIGPDYLDLGCLKEGDFIVDFPDGSTLIISYAELSSRFTICADWPATRRRRIISVLKTWRTRKRSYDLLS